MRLFGGDLRTTAQRICWAGPTEDHGFQNRVRTKDAGEFLTTRLTVQQFFLLIGQDAATDGAETGMYTEREQQQ